MTRKIMKTMDKTMTTMKTSRTKTKKAVTEATTMTKNKMTEKRKKRATMMNLQRNDRKPHERNSEGMLIEPWVGNAQAAIELCLVLVINVDHLL